MNIPAKLRPQFWEYRGESSGPFIQLVNFRRLWHLAVLSTSLVAMVPLVALVLVDSNVTRQTAESTIVQTTAQTTANT